MKNFDAENLIVDKITLCKLIFFSGLFEMSCIMRKPAFCYFWASYSDIIFYIDHYSVGVSNKHCYCLFSSTEPKAHR